MTPKRGCFLVTVPRFLEPQTQRGSSEAEAGRAGRGRGRRSPLCGPPTPPPELLSLTQGPQPSEGLTWEQPQQEAGGWAPLTGNQAAAQQGHSFLPFTPKSSEPCVLALSCETDRYPTQPEGRGAPDKEVWGCCLRAVCP